MSRASIYIALNIAVAVAAAAGFVLHKAGVHPLYVIALFAICSTPLFEARTVNGPYSLLVLWSADYFLMYGALDLRNLLLGVEGEVAENPGVFTAAEALILFGGVLVQIFYRLACRRTAPHAVLPKDWPEMTLVLVGVTMWIVATRLCWEFNVNIMVGKISSVNLNTLENLGGAKVGLFMLARMAQPLSILILAYAQCRYRRTYMAPLLLAVVLFQVLFGFIVDTKGDALIGGVLVVLTNLLVRGRMPKAWTAVMIVIVAAGFPILQANRVVRDELGVNATKASQDILEAIKRAVEATDRANTGRERAQTVLERLTTKGSVELIVRGTGTSAPFQYGYTLAPMAAAFIPRMLWPDKPSVATGQLLNHTFHVSEASETYISPSHLGELYWNFGWAGVLVGMSGVGLLLGTLGRKFNLAEAATITRVLILVVTVRQLILSSEGEFATTYVVWMRSMLGIALLHLAFARVGADAPQGNAGADSAKAIDTAPFRPFPNLLR